PGVETPDKLALVTSATAQLAKLARDKEEREHGSLTGEGGEARAAADGMGMSKKDALKQAIREENKKFGPGDLQLVDLQESGAIFSMRSALGNRFNRGSKCEGSKLKADLARCKPEEDIMQLKKDWADKKYSQLQAKHKEKVERYEESFIKQGELMSALRMCAEEGGPEGHKDPETVKTVFGIACRCLEMGYPFAQMCPQSRRVKFMYFRTQWRESFTKRWELVSRHGVPISLDTKPTTPRPNKKPSPIVEAMRSARKLATSCAKALTTSKEMLDNIGTKKAWSWGKTGKVKGRITLLRAGLTEGLEAAELTSMLFGGFSANE
ncbi:unnamed protein product, partial [Prorocentrum cordatum]